MPDEPKPSFRPSSSTVASVGIGIPVATVIVWLVGELAAVEVPGPVEAAIGVIISAVVGYFFSGGKHEDVA